jgi:arylsulfatase A-like enzyme
MLAFPSALALAATPATAPNIVFILTDDVRWDELGFAGHPFAKSPHIDRIAREGVIFRNAFATTVICSPSRASFLTGQYPHTHGIVDNTDRSPATHRLTTFPQMLQSVGYETAFIGKWHMGNDDTRRPGFDHWVCLKGQGSSFDAELNVDGRVLQTKGYVTDVLTERALAFLRAPRSKPFLLYFAHKAVHPESVQRADGSLSDPDLSNFIPAERHQNLYAGAKIPRRPNALVAPTGKPALQRALPGLPPLGPATGSRDAVVLGRLRMLAAVDESVGELFKVLEAAGQLDRTLVVFTSDHGYYYGEHGLSVERRLAYEEGIRIPLLLRYPPLIQAGSRRNQMTLNVDLAPTLLEFAGAPVPPGLHGKSFLSLLSQNGPALRDAFLIEHFSDHVFPRVVNLGYQAVRTEGWKYIHYTDITGADELYDLNRDPYEMRNIIADPRLADNLRSLQEELLRQLHATGGVSRGALPETGFEPLFDGETLAGWKIHDEFSKSRKEPPASKWWVENGILTGTPTPAGKGGFLWVDRPFADFVLKLEVSLDYPIDTGIFLRTDPAGRSHQVMLDYLPGGEIGAIYIPFERSVHRNPDGIRAWRRNAWNEMEIRMEGEPARIRAWLNGQLITDFQHTAETNNGSSARGGIALQVHRNATSPELWKEGNAVRYRNIRIRELR